MARDYKKWAIGCGSGCILFFVVGIAVTIGGSYMMIKPLREAIEVRESLDEIYPGQESYTPSVDGISAQRMDAFLAVRKALQPTCLEFKSHEKSFEKMDDLGAQDDPTKSEVMTSAWEVTKAAFGMAPMMGRFFHTRNQALLQNQMGFGEYTYLYAVVYGNQLQQHSGSDHFFGTRISGRVSEALQAMMARYLEQAILSDRPQDEIHLIETEVERLMSGKIQTPWQDGLPPFLGADIEPLRDDLDLVYCPSTVTFELSRNRQKGPSIISD